MLARIQQLIVLILSGTALTSFAVGAAIGHAWLGPVIVAAMAAGYLGVLALEFKLLERSFAHDDPLRPPLATLAKAWAREVTFAPRVFLWRQPFRARSEPDHIPAPTTNRRGVLLVHGFFCNRGLWNPWLRRLRALDVPFVAVDLEPILASVDSYRATIDAAALRLERATGLAPVVVCHSMGGLAARAWLAGVDRPAPVHRLITIATPHDGTRIAGTGRGANVREMRHGSAWLRDLARRERESLRSSVVCFWSHCDNIVFPVRNATLAGADNRHLAATPHVQMVEHPEVFAEVLRSLE